MILNFIRDSQGKFIANSFSDKPSEGVDLVVQIIPYSNKKSEQKLFGLQIKNIDENLVLSNEEALDIINQSEMLIKDQINLIV